MEIGFGVRSIWPVYTTTKTLIDDMDVRVIVVREKGVTAAWAITDLTRIRMDRGGVLRKALAEALDIPLHCVAISATQNHCPPGDIAHLDLLCELVADAARSARESLTEAHVARVTVHPNPALNFCRRHTVEGLGAFTFWYGQRNDSGRSDITHLLRASLSEMKQSGGVVRAKVINSPEDYNAPPSPVPLQEPVYSGPAKDDALQALFFRSKDGEPLGALLRFPTHPATGGRHGDTASGDYCAYVRRRLEQRFGGTGMFMTGPCGDSFPLIERKGPELSEQLGSRLADLALEALPSAKWETNAAIGVCSPEVTLYTRADFPRSALEGERELGEIKERIRAGTADNAPLHTIKPLMDRAERLGYYTRNTLFKWMPLEPDKLASASIQHPLFVLRFGETVVAGLPGEPFNAFSARLRRETIGDALITGEQCNAGFGYIPTADEFPLGSYECNATVFDERAEETLVNGVKAGMKKVL